MSYEEEDTCEVAVHRHAKSLYIYYVKVGGGYMCVI